MDKIQVQDITVVTGTTSIPLRYIDKYDQLMIRIPKVVGFCGSSVVAITLQGSPNANITTPIQMNYYDYVNKTPASCVITISTGGIYEFPYPGAQNYLSLQFDIAVTSVTNIQMMSPKTTY